MQTCYSPGKPQDPPIRPGCRSNKSRRGSANKSPPAAGGSRSRPYAPVQNAVIAGKKIYFWRKKMKKSKFKLFAALLLAAAMTVLSLSGAAPVLADETAAILANAANLPPYIPHPRVMTKTTLTRFAHSLNRPIQTAFATVKSSIPTVTILTTPKVGAHCSLMNGALSTKRISIGKKWTESTACLRSISPI